MKNELSRIVKHYDTQVSFKKALKALRKGKAVYCFYMNDVYFYHMEGDKRFETPTDQCGDPMSIGEMVEGFWFIEGDEYDEEN